MKALLLLLFLAPALPAQQPDKQVTLYDRLATMLQREANGHSPTDDDIAATRLINPAPSADEVKAALPAILLALQSPDGPARTYTLSLLVDIETPANQPGYVAPPADVPHPPILNVFPPPIAAILTTAIPQLATHLTDDVLPNRSLTATILGGFTPNPPPTLYPPLYNFLKRPDAIGETGSLVVDDILQLAPLSVDSVAAIAKYIHRSDQTSDTRANLADDIATSPNQNQTLNKSLIAFLSSDDSNLRARIILSLPALDLSPDLYTETHTRILQLVDNSNESLQVVNAARAVASCWTATKMTTGCPTY